MVNNGALVKKVTGAASGEHFFILPPRASRSSTYRILPPRASLAGNRFSRIILAVHESMLNLSHTASASLPGSNNHSRNKNKREPHKIFHWKNRAFFHTFLLHVLMMIYGFYESKSPRARRGGSGRLRAEF